MSYENDSDVAVGIDLGTTYSCVAYMTPDGRFEVVPNEQGNRTTPSYVAFTPTGERLVGDGAKNQAAMNPANTVFDAKRLIGRSYDDESVRKDMKLWPFTVTNVDGAPHIKIETNGKEDVFSPQAISAMVLTKMKNIAEMKLGANVKKAVITVPAYFNDAQRQATKDAGVIAGLDVLRIINEPTAAAIAYGLDQRSKDAAASEAEGAEATKSKKEKTVLIFDLGGGTFDVSLLTVADSVFTVKATAGDTHLGGEDFDNNMVNFFSEDFKKRHTLELSKDARALRRLRSASERAKRTLSTMTKATIEIDSLFQGVDYATSITRAKFEELNNTMFQSTLEPVRKVLEDSGVKKSQVDEIVLVGGSTRIPKIQSLLADFFEIQADRLNKSINPDEAVACGAAAQAAIMTGAATQTTGDLLLLDVAPLSLGVEMEGQLMGVVVPRNTPIPTIMKRVFTTTYNNQTTVEFPIYEGERAKTTENNMLGTFSLSGLPPMPRGVPELEVVFDMDANGILKVTATELTSNLTANVTISNNPGRLSQDAIQKMIDDAAKNRDADAKHTQRVEAKQNLEEFIYQTRATLVNAGPAVARSSDAAEIISALETQMEWLDINRDTASSEEFQNRRRILERSVSKAYTSLSQNQGNSRNARRGGNANANRRK